LEVTPLTDKAAPSSAGGVSVTVFVCANCAARYSWPFPICEIAVPCTGRLQPEHVLKAFESGAGLVFTLSCENDHCLYLQGAERWSRRAEYVRGILDEIGLGGERLMDFRVPDNAPEGVAAMQDTVLHALAHLAPNPLTPDPMGAAESLRDQLKTGDDDYEE
jgi:coenzyme F420-reducing hydrogenase delta subunit